MTSVLIISSGPDTGLAHALARGFQSLGSEASVVPEPLPRTSFLGSLALRNRVRLPRHALTNPASRLPPAGVAPSVIIFAKTPYIPASEVRRLSTIAPTVCWNADSPFDSAPSNSGGSILEALTAFDAYVTWSSSLATSLADLRDRVYRLPFAWDPKLGCSATSPSPPASSGDVVFVGTVSPERQAILRRLAPLRPVVYGGGWDDPLIDSRPPVYGTDFARVVEGAKWALNLLRPQNRDSHNMRTFELAGLGANQLTFDTADHRYLLEGTRHRLVGSVDELLSVAKTDPALPVTSRPELPTYADRCRDLLLLLDKDGLL